MKNVLAIEIKDNKTIVTLAKVDNGDYSLILHKTYNSKAVKGNNYDGEIVDQLVQDLREINIINDIDETLLTINSSMASIDTMRNNFNYANSNEAITNHIQATVEKQYPMVEIVKISNLIDETQMTTKTVWTCIEANKIEFKNEVIRLFKQKGIKFTKIVSTIDAISNSIKHYESATKTTISILVEAKFIQLTWFKNGALTSAVKWKGGLDDIYNHIVNQMSVNKQMAKKLFQSFGSIPPEDVVDDKVIYSNRSEDGREIIVYTKKDLSRMITEKVQDLFANVKDHIDKLKGEDEVKIVFNGEIKALTGFRKFASKSFNEPDIKKYKSTIIGLRPETEFITMGMLSEVKDIQGKKKKEHLYTQKNSLLSKVFRMYNYL